MINGELDVLRRTVQPLQALADLRQREHLGIRQTQLDATLVFHRSCLLPADVFDVLVADDAL